MIYYYRRYTVPGVSTKLRKKQISVMAAINGSSGNAGVISNKSRNVPQCSGLVSDGNGREEKSIEEKSVRWGTDLKYDGNHNDELATERLQAPRSGMRRNSASVSVFNGSENVPYNHAEAIRPQGSRAWLRLKELVKRPLPKESSNIEINKPGKLDCNGEKITRFEEVVETICKEQCFERNLIVKALPDEAPSQENVIFVTRSYEVNPTSRQNWSVLKEAVMSGRIMENTADDNERSGLRRLSLVPTKGLDVTMAASSDRQGRNRWLKVKAMISDKVLSTSSKHDVNDNENSLRCSDSNDKSFGENTSEVISNAVEEELCTDIDSIVQALPSDAVNRDEVVSVTRSFEYDKTWVNAREILRTQRRCQEENDGLSGTKNSKGSVKLVADVVRNAVLKKDAFCQTEFDGEGIFEHQIVRNIICGTCGSKYEEKQARKIEGYRFRKNEAILDEDEGEPLVNYEKIEEQEEKIGSRLNFHDECRANSSGARLVEDRFQDSEALTKLEKGEDEEVRRTLENGLRDGSRYSFDTEKIEFQEEDNGSIYIQIRPKKNEIEEYSTNRAFILEKCANNTESDSGKANEEGKRRDHPSETPEAESVTMIQRREENQVSTSEQRQKDLKDLNLVIHIDERKEVMVSDTDMVMSIAKVARDNSLKGMKGSRTPVTITARFYECAQPSLKMAEIVKVVRDVDTQLCTISYV